LIFGINVAHAKAQPGWDFVFVNVVDGSGERIRDAWVKVIPRGDSAPSFLDPSRRQINIVDRSFLPTDGSHSRFVAWIIARTSGEYEVEATAEGFHPLRKTITMSRSSSEHTFVLEPNGKPRPVFPKLVTLSGRMMNTFGEPMSGLRVQGPTGYFYSPEFDGEGNFTIEVVPGDYRIEFWPASCTRYTLEDYVIGESGRVLNLTTECKFRRGDSGVKTK
jgi:hypothetical protein